MTGSSNVAHALTATSLVGTRIAERYVIEEMVARGGMGEVYRVRDGSSGEVRALKRVRLDQTGRRGIYMAAFEREFQVLAGIDHPGIIRVFEYGVQADGPYYTMELVTGPDLSKVAPVPYRDACRRLREVASALSLLHARRLVYRDLSPSNVKITPSGHCKLLDFGALTDFGYPQWVVGTAPMMAPEALGAGMLDQRTDLYALGALAYFLLSGRHAYPARTLEELHAVWKHRPVPPSSFDPSIPRALDALVLGLLSKNALARPSSAAEVIAHLEGIAGLEPEPDVERKRLARSFLTVPRFVGRGGQLRDIAQRLSAAVAGSGATLRVQGGAGTGRTRLLEEVGVRAQIVGATVLRVDASMHPGVHGTSRALGLRLVEALPSYARERAARYVAAIAVLDRPGEPPVLGPVPPPITAFADGVLEDWFFDVSAEKPLVMAVDNVDLADDASLGLLVAIARRVRRHGILLLLSERPSGDGRASMGLRTLRELSQPIVLANLTVKETLEHARAMFGGAPNVERFSEWLFARTAGNPLHCVEISRQLVERGVVAYERGMWVLPTSEPEISLPAGMSDVLAGRVAALTPAARRLAACLALSRVRLTLPLCSLLADDGDPSFGRTMLEELAQRDVVQRDQGDFRFTSTALREVVQEGLSERERAACHLRLARAFERLAGGTDHMLRIEAGFHLIQAGCELEGADLIQAVTCDTMAVRTLSANMYRIGPPAHAALKIYDRHGRGAYQRMPLLAALAQAGWFESASWDERYGDEALSLLSELSGMTLSRKLRYLGRTVALGLGLSVAMARFYLTPRTKRERHFLVVLMHLFGTVLALTGTAILRLDGDRAARVASVLEPFSALPRDTTAPGIYRLCVSLQQVTREHQAVAYRYFDRLTQRFEHRGFMGFIPRDARVLFVAAAHIARGVFSAFRDDGKGALESATVLHGTGLRLYAMLGSQIRYLYHANRGDADQAARHRAEVELHAAHFGSAWQVERWEGPALLPLNITLGDASALARIEHRLDELAQHEPSLARYHRLARLAVLLVRGELSPENLAEAERELDVTPRSFIGWSAAIGTLARAYNELGRHDAAKRTCARALHTMSEDDREYVTLFLEVDVQAAVADAGLGDPDGAIARLDRLIERFSRSNHPLTLGKLHEARARIAFTVEREDLYQHSLAEVERWFGRSNQPALVAIYERLADLKHPVETVRGRRLLHSDLIPISDTTEALEPET